MDLFRGILEDSNDFSSGVVSGIYISVDLETIQKADQSGAAFFRWLYIDRKSVV